MVHLAHPKKKMAEEIILWCAPAWCREKNSAPKITYNTDSSMNPRHLVIAQRKENIIRGPKIPKTHKKLGIITDQHRA